MHRSTADLLVGRAAISGTPAPSLREGGPTTEVETSILQGGTTHGIRAHGPSTRHPTDAPVAGRYRAPRGIPRGGSRRWLSGRAAPEAAGDGGLARAELAFEDCRAPAEHRLGGEGGYEDKQGFLTAMKAFDNTRPLVAVMALGIGRDHRRRRDHGCGRPSSGCTRGEEVPRREGVRHLRRQRSDPVFVIAKRLFDFMEAF